MTVCEETPAEEVVPILVKIVFIFTFLTVFFFVYVISVEQKTFKKQMDIIVDNLAALVASENGLIIKPGSIPKDQIHVLADGIIGILEAQVNDDSVSAAAKVIAQNNKVKFQAYRNLAIIFVFTALAVSIIYLLGVCTPLWDVVKKSLLVVLFTGTTEFVFLTLIVSKYISADPNKVKKQLGESVQRWIAKHEKNVN